MEYPRKIYAIQHNVTKKIYIGSSADVESRYMTHMSTLRHQKHGVEDLQDDFNEYGEDFSLFILDEIQSWEERHKEQEYMKKYNTLIRGIGYNYKDNYTKRKPNLIPYKDGTPTIDEDIKNDMCDMKTEYINNINEQLHLTEDLSMLDFVYRLLVKGNSGE